MIDLIGFWLTVTVCTVVLVLPLLHTSFAALGYFVCKITDGDISSDKVYGLLAKIYNLPNKPSSLGYVMYFRRVGVPVSVAIPVCFLGIFGWAGYCAYAAASIAEHGSAAEVLSLAHIVSVIGTSIAPFVGWVGSVVGGYFGVLYSLRFMYRKLKQVTKDTKAWVVEVVSDHERKFHEDFDRKNKNE